MNRQPPPAPPPDDPTRRFWPRGSFKFWAYSVLFGAVAIAAVVVYWCWADAAAGRQHPVFPR